MRPANTFPATSMQSALLVQTLLDPSGTYFQQLRFRIEGRLNREAFSAAWGDVMARHAALRSTVVFGRDEIPRQRVLADCPPPIEWIDCSDQSPAEQRRTLEALLERDRNRGLPLDSAPLMRITIARLHDAEHFVLWSFQHIILDGWSTALVLRELAERYSAHVSGTAVPPDPLDSYGIYFEWLGRQNGAAAEQFWRSALAGWKPAALPSAHPVRDSGVTYGECCVTPGASVMKLAHVAAAAQVTLSSALAAAWSLLLARVTRQADVLFGITVSGRPAEVAETEALVGLFINTIPMRVTLKTNSTGTDLLRQVQARFLDMRQYEFAPLLAIQSWSDAGSGRSLFDTHFVFENYPLRASEAAFAGIAIRDLKLESRSNYPLNVVVEPGISADQTTIRLVYDRACHSDRAVRNIARLYGKVIDMIGSDPDGIVAIRSPRFVLQDPAALEGEAPGRSDGPRIAELSDPVVDLVTGIWCDALHIERVALSDDVFRLGADSLIAVRVLGRLRQAFEIDLPAGFIFEQPSLAAQVASIRNALSASVRVRIRPQAAGHSPQMSDAQRRIWFVDQLTEEPIFNIPMAVRCRGALRLDLLHAALKAVVRRHEILRTTYREIDGEPSAVSFTDVDVDLPVLDAGEEEAQRLIAVEVRRKVSINSVPPLRALAIRIADDDILLLLIVHHIAIDAWSTGILLRDIEHAYSAVAVGRLPLLEPLPIQYSDYAAWQNDWLATGDATAELAYWRRQLQDAPALVLQTDRPRPRHLQFAGDIVPFTLADAMGSRLAEQSRREQATPFILLLAAFKLLLAWESGQNDIVVGASAANRSHPDTQQLIGFFLNQLTLRTDLSGALTFRDVVHAVRRVALDAYAHQSVPFERVVHAVNPRRASDRMPLYQIAFALEELPAFTLPGVEIEHQAVRSGIAKYDLELRTMTAPHPGGEIEYNVHLFERATIERLAASYRRLLEHVLFEGGSLPLPELRLAVLGTPSGAGDRDLRLAGIKRLQELGRQRMQR